MAKKNNNGSGNEPVWVDLDQISAHPNEPRIVVRATVVDTIATAIAETGEYLKRYSILLRPIDGGYQRIAGKHRMLAAKQAGLTGIWAWVTPMDDDEAMLELVRSNSQSELYPIEIGLHALTYEGEISLKQYAERINRPVNSISELRKAAKAFLNVVASAEAGGLTEADTDTLKSRLLNKSYQMVEIGKVPEDQQLWAALQMLEEDWTVAASTAAQKAINAVCGIPAKYHGWLDPSAQLSKAVTEAIAGNTRVQKDVALWCKTAEELEADLDPKRLVWIFPEEGKPRQVEVDLQGVFRDALDLIKNPSKLKIQQAAQSTLQYAADSDREYEAWELANRDDEAAREERERAAAEMLARNIEYAPVGILGDMSAVELPENHFDLVITDPSYLLSNGGTTNRSGKEVSVDKNFDDTRGEALPPEKWLPVVTRSLKPGGVLVFTATTHLDVSPSYFEEFGVFTHEDGTVDELVFLELLYWKKNSVPARLTPTGHCCDVELIWVARKKGAPHTFNYDLIKEKYCDGKQPRTTLEYEQCSGTERVGWHDTQKPLSLWGRLIDTYAPDNANVLDPFAGSGTTAVYCKQNGHKCTWVEKDAAHFDKAVSRIDATQFPWEI